jgi:SHS2 domain-containing protein
MPYRYLEDIAIADEAFEAWGETAEEMFAAASDAILNIMVKDLDTVRAREYRHLRIESPQMDMLLFQMLQELVYFKDAEQLLLRAKPSRIMREGDDYVAFVEASG